MKVTKKALAKSQHQNTNNHYNIFNSICLIIEVISICLMVVGGFVTCKPLIYMAIGMMIVVAVPVLMDIEADKDDSLEGSFRISK